METLVKNIIIIGKYKLLPCLNGIVNHIKSLKELYAELKNEGYSFVLTSRLNQDCVENIFSQIRGMANDTHPGPVEFTRRLENIIWSRNRYQANFKNPNTELEVESGLLLTQEAAQDLHQPPEQVEVDHHTPEAEEVDDDQEQRAEEPLAPDVDFEGDELMVWDHDYTSAEGPIQLEDENYNNNNVNFADSHLDGLSYIGGYLCRKLCKEFPNLGSKTCDSQYDPTEWVSFVSNGGLYVPSEDFWDQLVKWERVFCTMNGDDIDRGKEPIKRLAERVQESSPEVDPKIILRWAKLRFHIRIKHLNKN